MGIRTYVLARLAELHDIGSKRPLTVKEVEEVDICLKANADAMWKLARLENLSLMASMTEDYNWQHELCAEIERIK